MIGKRLLCLLGSLNLIITLVSAITTTPQSMQITEMQNDNKNVVNKLEINKHSIIEKLEKDREEFLKKKQAEKEKELENQKKQEPQWQEFIVSFYTGLDEENFSGCGGKNCLNQPLERGMIANNALPLGTKIFLDNDYGIRTVADKGSSRFNAKNRIDLYVARWDGETREQWKRRAESYGIKYIRGYVLK